MRKHRRINYGILALALSFVLLLSGTMAYFTDRADTSATGHAGTVDIDLISDVALTDADGKDILNPGDGREVNFTIPNLGNKSVDIKETIKLTSSVPMTEINGQAEFELYKTDDVEFIQDVGYIPKNGTRPLTQRTLSEDGRTITYDVPVVVLDGNHNTPDSNYETEPEADGKDTEVEEYTLIFRNTAGNDFQGASVVIEKHVDAKQHRNTGNNWNDVLTETYTFKNGDTISVVPAVAETEPVDEPENEKDVYLKTGPDVNEIMQNSFTSAKHLIFTDTKAPEGYTDVSFDENSAVAAWMDGDTLYISSQRAGRKVIAQPDSSMMFYAMPNLETADVRNLDVSAATDLSAFFMACPRLSYVDTTGWDTSHVREFYGVFAQCSAIETLPTVSAWDTSSAIDLACMFYGCENLESLNINNWNTSSVTDMNSVFLGVGLSYLDLSNWDVDQVKDYVAMFNGSQLQTLDLSGWQVNQDGYFDSIFSDSQNLENIYASDWRPTAYDYMYRANMFSGCIKLPNCDTDVSGAKAYPGDGGYFTAK